MLQDLRFAVRSLRHTPGFVAAVIATLALGIGATTAIFALINAILLHPLSLKDPSRVFAFSEATPYGISQAFRFDHVNDMRARLRPVMAAAFEAPTFVSIRVNGVSRRMLGDFVSANFFDVLGRPPVIGRGFRDADDFAGAEPVVVLGYDTWQRSLGADPRVVGSEVRVSGEWVRVVGVAAPDLHGTDVQQPADVFFPAHVILRVSPLGSDAGNYYFVDGTPGWSPSAFWRVFGRVHPGVSARAVASLLPHVLVTPIEQAAVAARVRGDVTRFSSVLFVAVLLVLVIGCANVAGLLLARAEGRRREIGIRLALGIKRARLVRQLLVESALLAVASGVAGVILERWIVGALTVFELPGFVPLGSVGGAIGGRVALFAVAVTGAAAIGFGLAPAMSARRVDVLTALKTGGGASPPSRGRYLLIATQVTLTVVLLAGAALFIRSLQSALSTDIGFDPHGIVVAQSDLDSARYKGARKTEYFDAAVRSMRAMPEIQSATYGTGPFMNVGSSTPAVVIDGRRVPLPQNVYEFYGGPSYFSTLGIRLRQGRDFTNADTPSAPSVVVVNSAFAKRFWPETSALGRHVSVPPTTGNSVVVGIADDGKYARLNEPARLAVFTPWKQAKVTPFGGDFVARVFGNAGAVASELRTSLPRVDRDVPVVDVQSLDALVDRVLLPQRLALWLLGGFGAIALVLGAIGIHGLVAFVVEQRRHEIGIRMALGADASDLVRVVVSGAAAAVAAGALAGLAIAWWLVVFVEQLLFRIRPHDPVALTTAVVLVVLAGTAGSLVPARRAARVDPMIALRTE